ncbi:MAG: hypothetical protein ACREQA_01740 [Candidatus Binatia bacterium]
MDKRHHINVQILNPKNGNGYKADVIALHEGKQVFRDRFKLGLAKSRDNFAKRCIKFLKRQDLRITKREAERIIQEIESQILTELNRLESSGRGSAISTPGNGAHSQEVVKPKIELIKDVTLTDVHAALQEIVSSPYCGDILEEALATVLNIKRAKDGDDGLLWLLVVAVPSSGKTQTVMGVRYAEPFVYFLSSLTSHSFTSGYINPKTGVQAKHLLSVLDGKCLVIKDLTALFSQKYETVQQILGDMVDIYDGYYSKFTGTTGEMKHEVLFSLVACITTAAIHDHQSYIEKIGSRFLIYRIPPLTEEERDAGLKRLREKGRKQKIKEFERLASSYVHKVFTAALPDIELVNGQWKEIKPLSELLRRGRGIIRDGSVFQMEEPFRIQQQLKAMAISLAHVHERETVTDHEMEHLRRIVLFTIPYNRASILALFQNPANLTPQGGLTVKGCSQAMRLSDTWAEQLLKELETLEILEVDRSQKEHEYRPLPEFAPIIAQPIKPLDHIADAALKDEGQSLASPSPTEIPPGQAENLNAVSEV